MSKKQILLIVIFFLSSVFLAWAIYLVFLKEKTTTLPPTTTNYPTGSLPQAGEGSAQKETDKTQTDSSKIALPAAPFKPKNQPLIDPNSIISEKATGGITKTNIIVNKPSYGVTLSGDGKNINLYDKNEGKFYRVDNQGKLTALSDKNFYDVKKINWAPNKKETILEYPDGNKIYFNFENQKQVTIPKHWQEFDFSSDSSEITFKSIIPNNPEENWLAIANPDGSEPELIALMAKNADKINVSVSPNNQMIGFVENPVGLDKQELYFIGKNDEDYRLVVTEGRDVTPLWSPTGNQLLYSVYTSYEQYKPTLWLINSDADTLGDNKQKIAINTWADRCTFNKAGTSIYCSVPKETPEYSGLFPSLITEQNIGSEIVKINPINGKITKLGEPEFPTNISKIFIDNNEENLYFQDGNDLTIKNIRLK